MTTPPLPVEWQARIAVIAAGLESALETDRLFDNYVGNRHEPSETLTTAVEALATLANEVAALAEERDKLRAFVERVAGSAIEYANTETNEQYAVGLSNIMLGKEAHELLAKLAKAPTAKQEPE